MLICIKAPCALDGCLAASAPILSFEGLTPPVHPDFFAKIVTSDASTEAGAPAHGIFSLSPIFGGVHTLRPSNTRLCC